MPLEEQTLAGRIIAIPETRELDVFAGLLERRGASVVRCPLVAIRDAPNSEPVIAWVQQVIAGECEDLILLTGEGLRRILSCIDRNAPTLREPFITALASVRKITRGPKPARALREIGLSSDLAAEQPTTDGVIASLKQFDLKGRTVGVQLYGTDPNERLMQFLQSAGAQTLTVAPYIYADKTEDSAVQSLGERLSRGAIDAIAFTSMQQVVRLFDVLGDECTKSALSKTLVASVGPVVSEVLTQRGVTVHLMPTDAYFLKPLTQALEKALGPKR